MDTTSVIILGLVGLAIGFLAGLLVSSLRGESAVRDSDATVSIDRQLEVSLGQDALRNQLIVQIDGKAVQSSTDLNQEKRQHLLTLGHDFLAWIGNEQPAGLAPKPDTRQPQIEVSPQSRETGWETRKTNSLVKPPGISFTSAITRLVQGEKHTGSPEEQTSMVEQINAILQVKLENSPFVGHGISLLESPVGGVVVVVGKETYPDVSAVPDEQIRRIIQKSVQQWEDQTTPHEK